jgi:hypothetical protein
MTLMADSECPKIETFGTTEHIRIAIEDNPYEDLLICLDGLCAWIDDALGRSTQDKSVSRANLSTNPAQSSFGQERVANRPLDRRIQSPLGLLEVPKGNILVHCRQGISRSGAIIVAYLMRSFSLNYDTAVAIAQTCRPAIQPNSGFADQLRLWHNLDYQLFTGLTDAGHGMLETKPQYEVWKSTRGILLTKMQIGRSEATRRLVEELVLLLSVLPSKDGINAGWTRGGE